MVEPSGSLHDEGVEATSTGDERVDAVLTEVAGLTDQPVEAHVAVFERAHDRLRRALDSQPDD